VATPMIQEPIFHVPVAKLIILALVIGSSSTSPNVYEAYVIQKSKVQMLFKMNKKNNPKLRI
jgi:hypothetical protein